MRKQLKAFTLIELLVVMAIIATLLTITLPRYFKSVDRSKEQVLKTNLHTMRESIDKYYADKGHYPASLEMLVIDEYMKVVPIDPVTESKQTWLLSSPKNASESGVSDVYSGAVGSASDHTEFSQW